MKLSTVMATVPRMLLAFSPSWPGPRPATVVKESTRPDRADVNIALHGVDDHWLLEKARAASSGNTIVSAPVFELQEGETELSADVVDLDGVDSPFGKVALCWPARPAAAAAGTGANAQGRVEPQRVPQDPIPQTPTTGATSAAPPVPAGDAAAAIEFVGDAPAADASTTSG